MKATITLHRDFYGNWEGDFGHTTLYLCTHGIAQLFDIPIDTEEIELTVSNTPLRGAEDLELVVTEALREICYACGHRDPDADLEEVSLDYKELGVKVYIAGPEAEVLGELIPDIAEGTRLWLRVEYTPED